MKLQNKFGTIARMQIGDCNLTTLNFSKINTVYLQKNQFIAFLYNIASLSCFMASSNPFIKVNVFRAAFLLFTA